MADLLKSIQTDLLPSLGKPALRIVAHSGSAFEMTQTVDLRAGDLMLRVSREKQVFEVLFSSVVDSLEWFDSSTVFQHLGWGTRSLTAENLDTLIEQLRTFIRHQLGEILPLFERSVYPGVRPELLQLRTAWNSDFLAGLKRKSEAVRADRGRV